MTGPPGLTAPRYHHWTETDERVHAYIEDIFGASPEHQELGIDLVAYGKTIEVKSCQEWIKANPEHCRGARRRRGRFHFCQREDPDFFLFCLVREDGELALKLLDAQSVYTLWGAGVRHIRWPEVFPLADC